MNRMIDGFCRLLGWTIALILALMVVLVFGNVVLRYALNSVDHKDRNQSLD